MNLPVPLKIAVVSAWLPEQQWLRESIKELVSAPKQVDFLLTGIGSLNASVTLAAYLEHHSPHKVLFCGTAGAYDPQCPLAHVAKVTSVCFCDAALLLGKGYLPGFVAPRGHSSGVPVPHTQGPAPLTSASCLSLPSITTCPDTATRLGQWAPFENLELGGVDLACQRKKIPWVGYLGVSNTVGPLAHEQWKQTHLRASLAAQEELMKQELL